MADKPILFSAPMISAILDGRKKQTRRVFKPRGFEFYTHPVSGDRFDQYRPYRDGTWDKSKIVGSGPMRRFDWGNGLYAYLRHAPGDRLWVREAWLINDYRYERPIPKSHPARALLLAILEALIAKEGAS